MRQIDKTSAYCQKCGELHDAEIIEEKNSVYGILNCPGKTEKIKISSDYEYFKKTRNRSFLSCSKAKEKLLSGEITKGKIATYIDITNSCNFKCPVCFASSEKNENNSFITIDDLKNRLERIKAKKLKKVTIFGGEPTIHPQILEILALIKSMRLKTILITNGFRLGKERDFAYKIKKAGVHEIQIQFDTFNSDSHKKIRGNDFIPTKLKAIENCINSSLKIGLVMTVTRMTLIDIPQIVKFALSLGPKCNTLMLQGVGNSGRFLIEEDQLVTREEIVESVCNTDGLKKSFLKDDFWPVPCYLPSGIFMHPDCVVFSLVNYQNNKIKPMSHYANQDRLFRKLNSAIDRPSFYSKYIKPIFLGITSVKYLRAPSMIFAYIKGLFSRKIEIDAESNYLKKPFKGTILQIYIESYANASFQDVQKTKFCPSEQVLKDTEVCACVYNSRQKEHPNSRVSVASRNEL